MDVLALLRNAPAALTWGTPGVRYARLDTLVAEHDRTPGTPAKGARLVLDDGRIAVWPHPPPPDALRHRLGPVYGTSDGHVAVPTGRILVRFDEGVDAAAQAADIEGTGFRIESVPGYAPHAAWVRIAEGDVVRALGGLARLAALAGVAHVEPQLLLPRATR